jgi:cell wall-associated NlpC family hydrolase
MLLGADLLAGPLLRGPEGPGGAAQAQELSREASSRGDAPARGLLMSLPGEDRSAGQVSARGGFRSAAGPEGAGRPEGEAVSAAPDAGEAAAPDSGEAAGEGIAEIARRYLGSRYSWAGSSPETGFDCSGFAWYTYGQAGLSIPKGDLQGQLDAGPRIELEELKPGDLVFFENTYKPGLSHVGVYVGDDEFIHAEWEETGVRVSKLQGSQWFSKFVGGSRPW